LNSATVKLLILALVGAVLSGCAAFDRQAEFPLERYPGATPYLQLLEKVNLEANLHRPCALIRRCQDALPSRDELQATVFLDAKGYAMAKAYALQNAGIDESRMRVAHFKLLERSHVVLVVDERYVLDNVYNRVRTLRDYERFHERPRELPETLMAQGRPGSAAVGR
jgi:hypothetical protein